MSKRDFAFAWTSFHPAHVSGLASSSLRLDAEGEAMIKDQLTSIINRLKEARDTYAFELEGIAAGRLLYMRRKDGSGSYYVCHRQDGKKIRRGISKQPKLVAELARKEYLTRAVAKLNRNIGVMEKAAARYQPCDSQSIISELSATYQQIPQDLFFHPLADPIMFNLDADDAARIASHRAWGETPYAPSEFMPESKKVITSRGEKMRSKSEVLIAEMLYAYGIPFRYEQELIVGGATFHPDFTFEGAGGQEFYLEFCGMMDDPKYVAAHIRKMHAYEDAGIVPWKNIIYVYESGNDIDMRRIDSIIRTQIIPWL